MHSLHVGDTIESDLIFIEQPNPLDLCALNGKTIFLNWKVQYKPCDWPLISLKTMNYTLHPNNSFLPIEYGKDINVTVDECNSDKTDIDITLSIHLNEDILEHVPYIVCIITRHTEGGRNERRSEELYLQANRNCFSTTAKQRTIDISNATMEILSPQQSDNLTNSASCVLPCNKSLNFINVPYYVMCVFIITLLDVLKY